MKHDLQIILGKVSRFLLYSLLLAGLIAMHAATDSQMSRRDRRPSERRFAEMRLVRRAEALELTV